MPPGGGGLVILPQKSWNVWRNDNRERVARDKKKHEAEEHARLKRQREVEAEIRLERLRGNEISNEEAQTRVRDAVESMNLDDYVERKTMRELADEHTRRLERQLDRPRKRRRLNSDDPFSKNQPHRDRDVKKSAPKEDFTPTSVPFNLFAGEESRGGRRKRRSLDKNPEREQEEKKVKDREENQRALAHSSVEKASNVPWYLVTDSDEIARRMPMLPENHQNALPSRHRDFNRDPRRIANRNARRKRQHDPLMEMDGILGAKHPEAVESDASSSLVPKYTDGSASFQALMSRFDDLDDEPALKDDRKKKKKKKKSKTKSASKKKSHKSKKKKKKKKRRRESSSDLSSSDDERSAKRKRSPSAQEGSMEKLREERRRREERERRRAERLSTW